MKRNLLAVTLTLTLAFFATLKSSDAQNVDSFGSNDSNATSSLDSSEISPPRYDVDLNSSSSSANGTNFGSTNPLTDVSSKEIIDVASFFEDHSESILKVVIQLLMGLAVLAMVFYLFIILPIRFFRWLFGGWKKDVETREKSERIYADVIHGKDSAHPYVIREDVTARVKWDKFVKKVIWLMAIGYGAFLLWLFAQGH